MTTRSAPVATAEDTAPLLICGHSLGSAGAAVAALAYALKYPGRRVSYIGFGTPRVGNAAWAKLFNSVVQQPTRVKNGADPVESCLPPVGYVHVGTPATYIHVGAPDPFPDVCLLLDITDHDMANYIKHLKQDDTSETPLAWVPYIVSFLNLPVKVYYGIRNAALYKPF